ncbi:hypothetical protein ACJX0J_042580, partial [Zea mays]
CCSTIYNAIFKNWLALLYIKKGKHMIMPISDLGNVVKHMIMHFLTNSLPFKDGHILEQGSMLRGSKHIYKSKREKRDTFTTLLAQENLNAMQNETLNAMQWNRNETLMLTKALSHSDTTKKSLEIAANQSKREQLR